MFAELQDSLDRIWRAPVTARSRTGGGLSGLWQLVRARVLSFGMILGIGFLLMVSLVISAALSALERWWAPMFGGWAVLAQIVNLALSFGMIYKIMPSVHVRWHDVWIGAAGSLVVVLVWVYYSAQIFLLGAEFTWVYAHSFGSRRGEARPGSQAATEAQPSNPTTIKTTSASAPTRRDAT